MISTETDLSALGLRNAILDRLSDQARGKLSRLFVAREERKWSVAWAVIAYPVGAPRFAHYIDDEAAAQHPDIVGWLASWIENSIQGLEKEQQG